MEWGLTRAEVRQRLWELNFAFGHAHFHGGHRVLARAAFAAALRKRPMHLKTLLIYTLSSQTYGC